MAENNLVVPAQFAARMEAGAVDDLRNQTTEDKSGPSLRTYDEFEAAGEIPEVQYGETVLGTLTDEEVSMYEHIFRLTEEYRSIDRELGAKVLNTAADLYRAGKERTLDTSSIISEPVAKQHFKLERELEYVRAHFFYLIGEKYNCHDYIVGVRTKKRVIKSSRKW